MPEYLSQNAADVCEKRTPQFRSQGGEPREWKCTLKAAVSEMRVIYIGGTN